MNWFQALLIIVLITASLFIGWHLNEIHSARKKMDKPLDLYGVKFERGKR